MEIEPDVTSTREEETQLPVVALVVERPPKCKCSHECHYFHCLSSDKL